MTELMNVENLVRIIRDNLDRDAPRELTANLVSLNAEVRKLMEPTSHQDAIRYMKEIHPCRGALRLIKGDDEGDIQPCLTKDCTEQEVKKLSERGTYLFWKCNSCSFRIKYLALTSRTASLLTSDDDCHVGISRLKWSPAFLAMSHIRQERSFRDSDTQKPARYTCLVCVLDRDCARPGVDHTFADRDNLGNHMASHFFGKTIPSRYVMERLGIEHSSSDYTRLPAGQRRFGREGSG